MKLSELFAMLKVLILVSRVDLFLNFFTTLWTSCRLTLLKHKSFSTGCCRNSLYDSPAVTSLLFAISFFRFNAILAKHSLKFSAMAVGVLWLL